MLRGFKILSVVLCLTTASSVFAQQRAVTDDGKSVILTPDGRWSYEQPSGDAVAAPAEPKKLFQSKTGMYGVLFNESVWQEKKPQAGREYALGHVDGDIYAFFISERIEFSLDAMKDIVLQNARDGGFDSLKITQQERKLISGKQVLYLIMEGVFRGAPIVYSFYIYSSPAGTLQFVVFTSRNIYQQYKTDILNLLNGLQLYK
jgi:hypothetical protein